MEVTNRALEKRVRNLVRRLIINTHTHTICVRSVVFLLQVTKLKWMWQEAGIV